MWLPSGVGKEKSARGQMNNKTERKIQFGGWAKRSYKVLRRLNKKTLKSLLIEYRIVPH